MCPLRNLHIKRKTISVSDRIFLHSAGEKHLNTVLFKCKEINITFAQRPFLPNYHIVTGDGKGTDRTVEGKKTFSKLLNFSTWSSLCLAFILKHKKRFRPELEEGKEKGFCFFFFTFYVLILHHHHGLFLRLHLLPSVHKTSSQFFGNLKTSTLLPLLSSFPTLFVAFLLHFPWTSWDIFNIRGFQGFPHHSMLSLSHTH